MISHPARLLLSVLAVAVSVAAGSSADAAKARKAKRAPTAPAPYAIPGVPANPGNAVYIGDLYIGTDPDANIRTWFQKDLSGRWGGSY